MRPSLRHALRVVTLAALAGCPLDEQVRYRCEPGGVCAPGFVCGSDDVCRPDATADGGVGGDDGGATQDAGPCTLRDRVAACQPVECGIVSDGCGGEYDCGKWCPVGQECGVQSPNQCAFAALRTVEGWTWEHPLPHGISLNGIWRTDLRHTWMVGEGGMVVFFNGERSRLEPAPAAGATLHGVHASRNDDVYAVGANGTVVHFDGARWTKEPVSPPVTTALRAVWTYGDGTAVAVGDGPTVLFRTTAGVWSSGVATGLVGDLTRVWHLARVGTFAMTRQGRLVTLAPSSLSNWVQLEAVPIPSARGFVGRDDLLYVSGTVNGRTAIARRFPDAGWDQTVLDAGVVLNSIAVNSRELWGVTNAGTNGSVVTLSTSDLRLVWLAPVSAPLNALAVAEDSDDALFVGTNGAFAVGRVNTAVSVRNTSVLGRGLNAVCGFGLRTGELFAAAGTNTMNCGVAECQPYWLERQVTGLGVTWVSRYAPLGNTTELLACYAHGPNRVWLTGSDSKFFYQQNGMFQRGDFTGAFGGQYRAGWGLPDAGYFFLRLNETDVTTSVDGVSGFSATSTTAQQPLNALWGTSPAEVVAVGNGGTVAQRLGGVWTSGPTTLSNDLQAVHGSVLRAGGTFYVAGGLGGAVLVRNPDGGLDAAIVDAALDFSGAWTSPDGTAWLAGRERVGVPATSSTWIGRKGPTDATWRRYDTVQYNRGLNGLFGLEVDGGTTLWVVGPGGTILRKD